MLSIFHRRTWVCAGGLPSPFRVAQSLAEFGTSTPCPNSADLDGLAKAYEPAAVEKKWSDRWKDDVTGAGPDDVAGSRFSLVLPPPNVTGRLHLGHALTISIQDALCRWRRMRGDAVIWVPGTDHAGIATQVIVEKSMWAEQRTTRHQLGREEFLKRVWKWKSDRSEQIHHQMKALGVTLDWDRAVFTMDPTMSAAVTAAFVRLYDAGLVYRSEALVNWCCHLQSAVSDIEVEHKTVDGAMVDFAYRWEQDPSEEIVVSTTRPETMLGDTAVAVHPGDQRWASWVGRRLTHPLRPGEPTIPVLADESVRPDFGTGAVKITPAHDPNDFEVGKRHQLESLTILSEDGRINENGGEFQGLTRSEARPAVLDALGQRGLLRDQRPHQLSVPVCSRTGDVIEPMVKHQWFVRCEEMAAAALAAVESGDLVLEPPSLRHVWKQWLQESRDWCVSRQLWWGHRIPAFCVTDRDGAERWTVAGSQQEAIAKLGLQADDVVSVRQDDDVMDTWFSSALFPFAVFGWPEQTADLSRWYPLSLMETGHDILFFWVARMVMLGQTLTGQLPFKKVLLHGLICDAHGRKMSKSLGNVIDPDHIIEGATLDRLHQQVDDSAAHGYISAEEAVKAKEGQRSLYPEGIPTCGADALRLSLCSTDLRNTVLNLDVREARQARLFGNKLWQACRFALGHLAASGYKCDEETRLSRLESAVGADRWMLSCLSDCVRTCSTAMDDHRLHTATAAVQQLLYRQFCDVYLEAVKPVLNSNDVAARQRCCDVMVCVLDAGLRLLHPFMPHLTEELGERLTEHSQESGLLLRRPYPRPEQYDHWRDEALESSFTTCLDAVRELRAMKTKYRIGKTTPEVFLTTEPALCDHLAAVVSTLARCRVHAAQPREEADRRLLPLQGHQWRALVDLQDHVNIPAELELLRTKMEKVRAKMATSDALMQTNKFRRRPVRMQQQERERRVMWEEELARLKESEDDLRRLS
ncbi:valine--tRNA ligase-like [Amphibalanus amphitrite]|uniref:valine--tRNA ligase-like n=1 Tax=Amphibalanus amphitrite TaxID=1232801 RepID=UPI001C9048E0|nr:valine--tRNA ligase-like [Amphibalanus amphitrite]XP_043242792.1 valine--tRNA ligase-like [Amphibalanus amphitrite]